jgi:hypothetical protein
MRTPPLIVTQERYALSALVNAQGGCIPAAPIKSLWKEIYAIKKILNIQDFENSHIPILREYYAYFCFEFAQMEDMSKCLCGSVRSKL